LLSKWYGPKNVYEKASSKKLGMDDQSDWVPGNAFLRNFRETFHKEEMDMIKRQGG